MVIFDSSNVVFHPRFLARVMEMLLARGDYALDPDCFRLVKRPTLLLTYRPL